MFGGHTDSWDVGQGAQDDGAGFMVSYEALYMIKKLGLRPARTIRLVGYAVRALDGRGVLFTRVCQLGVRRVRRSGRAAVLPGS